MARMIPVHIDLDVKGAVLAYPGDKIVIATHHKPKDDAERAEMDVMAQHLTEFLGIAVVIVDSVQELAVVKGQSQPEHILPPHSGAHMYGCPACEAKMPSGGESFRDKLARMEHDFNMPHKVDPQDGFQCPPNCPANPEKLGRPWTKDELDAELSDRIMREPQPGFITKTPGMELATEVGLPDARVEKPDYTISRNPGGELEFRKGVPIGNTCRRCGRLVGNTYRLPCGDCPDFADTALQQDAEEALAALRAKLSGEEIDHAHESATQEGAAPAASGGDAGWPDPPGFSKPGQSIAQPQDDGVHPPSYYDIAKGKFVPDSGD